MSERGQGEQEKKNGDVDSQGGHVQNRIVIDDDPEPEPQTIDLFEEANLEEQPGDAGDHEVIFWDEYTPELNLNFDEDEDDMPTHLKIIDWYEKANQEVQAKEAGYGREIDLCLEEEDYDLPKDLFLFEMPAPKNNVLTIPVHVAAEYFVLLYYYYEANPEEEPILIFTDAKARNWEFQFSYNPKQRAFTNSIEWTKISELFKLNGSCFILFYRPVPRSNLGHYLIEFDMRLESEDHDPEFRMENFLFQLELDHNARIFLPRVEVIAHLPEVRIPQRLQKTVTIKFTDGQRKNWYMDMVRNNVYSYAIRKGWEEFVKKHNLAAMDVIRIYKPVNPSNKKHFLIEIVKS